MKTNKIIKGVKGFDEKMMCRDFQYEEGKEYEIKETPVRCTDNGFHFCENPLEVFGYYSPGNSVYHEVEGSGEVDRCDDDSKVAVSKIKISVKIGIKQIIENGIKFIFERVKFTEESNTTGYQSGAQATGNQSGAQATGYRSMSSVNGDYSTSSVDGKESAACGLGYKNKAKASLNSWIILSERNNNNEILCIKTAKIDGNKMKADTWYILENGKFIIEK